MSMNKQDKAKLAKAAKSIADLLQKKKDIDFEIKEICAKAAEDLGIGHKVVREAGKELNMGEAARAKKRLFEDEMDICRHALGILVDLPLGEAALEREGATVQ